ncbi:MAG: cell division protein ZapA [Spirochaetaceae bacterium]|jgi:cell division protein ZapA (FtsZ GTPase activity inhibitor)|nr:cell division protein ZapA [Spirochaetaceae bacterium]
MAESAVLRVDLLGTSFSLTVEGDQSYLQAIYGRYRTLLENTKKNTGVEDPLKLAILTGLQLCDDVEKLRSWKNSDTATLESMQTEKCLLDLIEKIEKALPLDETLVPGIQGQ